MHKTGKRLGVLVLALCLLMSVALSKALAEGEGSNTLRTIATASTDEAFVADINTANIVVDVYKLADATKMENYDAYDYTLVAPFTGLQSMFDGAQSGGASTWEDVANSAMDLIGGAEKVASDVPVGEEIRLDDGIYLVIPHGEDVDEPATAYSDSYRYTFAPSIVALPTKVQEGYDQQGYLDGPIGTAAEYGDWTTEVTIALKPSQQPLYGDLIITKNVTELAGSEPATFVFHVTGEGYDEYASVYVTSTDPVSTTLEHIPVGLEVTVVEEYGGGRYTPRGEASATATIVSSQSGQDTASVSFTNEPGGSYTSGGHGIENHFEYTTDGDQWVLTSQTGLVAAETQE